MISKKFSFLSQLWSVNRYKKNAGVSITELLVAMVVAGIAITGLLAAMVELLQTDQREAAREETQQSIQTALDFIAEDLRESVYVYDGTQRRGADGSGPLHYIYDYLPDFSSVGTPILAFWKTEPLSASQESDLSRTDCARLAQPAQQECNNLKLRRRSYSLIVYLQSTIPDPKWKGKSRILRYELPKYDASNFSTLAKSPGFVDPAEANNFPTWPLDSSNTNLQFTQGAGSPSLSDSPPEVLVDFVDEPASTINIPDCVSSYGSSYVRLPSDDTNNRSFFACVRRIGNEIGQNQDIILYLRGNTYGKEGANAQDELPTLQTRVTLRGVIDKFN
jgi:type II secretory pathway pseudopilin PulG